MRGLFLTMRAPSDEGSSLVRAGFFLARGLLIVRVGRASSRRVPQGTAGYRTSKFGNCLVPATAVASARLS